MTDTETDTEADVGQRHAQFRYGVVFLIVLTTLVFEVVTPDSAWVHGISVALLFAALTVSVATSRARGSVRRLRTGVVAVAALLFVIGIVTGVLDTKVAFLVGTLVTASIPLALVGGLVRLIREDGVTLQAVAGALAIYLLIGLLFASVVAFVSVVENGSYFVQTANASNGVRVYYSFTVLTTTGFGDYTAAKPAGHALAVLEMLTGQLYLVTVVGVLIGNFAGRRRK
jgi:Ion channel